MDQLPFSELTIRIAAFVGIFSTLCVLELALPRRTPDQRKGARWLTNLSMVIVDSIALRVIFPLAAVGTAIWAESQGYGLLRATGTPAWVAGLVGFIVLDFAVWLEHVASHKIPILWRIHRMHHSDVDFDLTTALRFHPLEIILSMLWKAAIIIALGVPVLAVLVFEIVLNGAAMFNHSNWKIPVGFDRFLRLFIVTPDMHRVHHSVRVRETDSNYGFNFPFWDRLFRTYTDQPQDGHTGMTIGLNEYRGDEPTRFIWSLLLPFQRNRPRTDRLAPEKAAAEDASVRTD